MQGLRGTGDLLRGTGFRRLYATRLVSQASDGVFQVALVSYVLFNPERATTAGAAAQLFAVLLLPFSVVGPFAGVLLDRWHRTPTLVVANLARAAIVLAVGVLVAGEVTNPLFYAVTLAGLSLNRFVLAGLSAALPHVVTPHRLVLANAVSTTSGTLATGVGLGLGSLVRAVTGADWSVLVVGSAAYAVAGWVAARNGRTALGPDFDAEPVEAREALRRVLRGLVDGARHVRGHPAAAAALAAITAHRFFYGISTVSTLLLYRNYFHSARQTGAALGGFGLVLAASGMGVALAAVVTPPVARRIGAPRWVTVLFLAAAVTQVVFGVPYRQDTFLAAALVLGVVAQGSKICVDSLVQTAVEQGYRGRVFAFYDVAFNVAFVAAAAVGAALLPTSGKSYLVLALVAAGYAATGLAYGASSRTRALPVVA